MDKKTKCFSLLIPITENLRIQEYKYVSIQVCTVCSLILILSFSKNTRIQEHTNSSNPLPINHYSFRPPQASNPTGYCLFSTPSNRGPRPRTTGQLQLYPTIPRYKTIITKIRVNSPPKTPYSPRSHEEPRSFIFLYMCGTNLAHQNYSSHSLL